MNQSPSPGKYHDQIVRISDLALNATVLTRLTFERCRIIGPAVLAPLGSTIMESCEWQGDFTAMAWIVPESRPTIIGAIGLLDCRLEACLMQEIGLAVPERALANYRHGFGL